MEQNAELVNQEQEPQEIEVEEKIGRRRFAGLLRDYADALEQSSPFTTTIRGLQICVPVPDETAVEYELDEKMGELEFSAKWKAGKKPKGESLVSQWMGVGIAVVAGLSVAAGAVALAWGAFMKHE
ncbi:MAG: amphi-Trp domain-containing protein [Candidatus Aquicultorales bacterium]